MASDYTTNFNLDKYVGTDKPNLRDQYNSAMDKIDAQLKISSDNAALAVQTANNAASAVSGKASQSDLNALSATVSTKASTTALNDEITARQNADTTLNGKIASIARQFSFQNANIMYVGDSWGSTGVYGVTKNWCQIVCEALHANYVGLTLGSTGYVNSTGTGGQSGNYLTRLQNWVGNSANDPSTIDYIFMMGGLNDIGSDASVVRAAIANTISYIVSNFPNAIIFLMPQIVGADPSRASVANSSYNSWKRAAGFSYGLGLGTANKVIVFDKPLYCLVGNHALMTSSDMVHPNQDGHNAIALAVLKSLFGGTVRAPISAASIVNKVLCNDIAYPLDGITCSCDITNNILHIAFNLAIAAGANNTSNAIRVYLNDILAINSEPYNVQPCGITMLHDYSGSRPVSSAETNLHNIDSINSYASASGPASFINLIRTYASTFNLTSKTGIMSNISTGLTYVN